MKDYYECRFSGAGGQGIMLAGQILAEAAGVYEQKNVLQTRSYGPEARGGASKSEVIISKESIDSLEVSQPDFLMALTQEAVQKYSGDLKDGSLVVIDPDYVDINAEEVFQGKNVAVYRVPVTAIARDKVGRLVTANVVALGVMGALTRVVSQQSLEDAVRDAVPPGTEDINMQALRAGYDAVKDKE